jgi:hypothetical protein
MSSRFPKPDAPLALVSSPPDAGDVDVFAASAKRADVVGGTLSFLKRRKAQKVQKLKSSLGTPGDFARVLMRVPHPAEWERDLRTFSPVTEDAPFLMFSWKQPPLDTERGRWCLYEAIPDKLISVERRNELRSAPYWTLPKEERQAQATQVSAFQWEMYDQMKVDVRPFWCLQGSEGGTPLHHSPMERKYLRMMGKPEWPAELGSLPFAPWDNRAKQAVLQHDRLHKLGGSVAALRAGNSGAALAAETEEMEREYRRRFWDHRMERLGPATELLAHLSSKEGFEDNHRRQTAAEAAAASNARDHFIATGIVPSPHVYRQKRIAVAQS